MTKTEKVVHALERWAEIGKGPFDNEAEENTHKGILNNAIVLIRELAEENERLKKQVEERYE